MAVVWTMIGVLTNDGGAFLYLFRILIPAIVLVIAVTIYSFSARTHRHLVLSPEGISIDWIDYRLSTTWDNVERIGTMRGNEILVLRQPAELAGWNAWWNNLSGWDQHIPLAPFGHLRGDSDLARDLHHYASHLFAEHHERNEEART